MKIFKHYYWHLSLLKILMSAIAISAMGLIASESALAANVNFDFQVSASGTGPFDGNNNPGNDANDTNNIIRTQDVITYKWEYGVTGGSVSNVVFAATVPANVELSLPPICSVPAGSNIATNSATGEQTITCKLSNSLASGSAGSVEFKARVLGISRTNAYVANGQTTKAIGSMSGSNITNSLPTITTPDLIISAIPKVDLLEQYAWADGAAKGQDGVTDGLVIRYPVALVISGGGKGSEALTGNLSFTSQMLYNGGPNNGQPIPGARLYTWRPGFDTIIPGSNSSCNPMGGDPWAYFWSYPNGKKNSSYYPSYGTPEWSVGDSGTLSCTQSGVSAPTTVTINGADTSGNHSPTKDYYGGNALPTDKTYLVVGTIHMWIPVSSITNNGGQLDVRHQISALNAKGTSGQANQEPTLTNNYWDQTFVASSGSFTSHYATDVDARGTPLPSMSAIYGGDGAVLPNQTFTDRVYLNNNGVLPWASGTILCTAIDNQTQEIAPIAGNNSSGVKTFSSGTEGTNYVIEYGTGNYPTPAAHKDATCKDSDSPTGWTSNLAQVSGGTSAVTKVRVRAITTIPPGDTWDIAVNLRARNTYPGTTNLIPIGTKVVQHSSFYISGYNPYGSADGWLGRYYDPDTNGSVGWGDRLTLTRAIARIDKQNVPNQPVINAVAGDEVQFVLKPSLTASISTGASTTQVTVTDILPASLDYVVGSGNLLPTNIVTNNDGTKTITWDLGVLVPNKSIPDITYRAKIRPDAPNNSTATNTAKILSPDDGSLEEYRTDTASVNIGNSAAFQIFKEVNKVLIDRNEAIIYTLNYANTGSSDLGTSQFIDVLPHLNDNRTPATNYAGTSYFSSISGTNNETFEYTKATPNIIQVDPNDPSNQTGGATVWCASLSGNNCPANNKEVMAIRVTAPAFPKNQPTRKLTLTINNNANAEDNYYSNLFYGRNSSLVSLLESNTVFSKVKIPARMVLVKRITKINNTEFNQIIDDPNNLNDNNKFWPSGYLKGSIDGGFVKPGDTIEYTIYYLSAGDVSTQNSRICDLVPTNSTFVDVAYNGSTPLGTGASPGANLGIQHDRGSIPEFLTSAKDGDRGIFFPQGNPPNTFCSGANANGAVVIDLGTIPHAGYGGSPSQSYGFVRFKSTVK